MSDDTKKPTPSKKRPPEAPADRPRPKPRLANPGRIENRYETNALRRHPPTRRPSNRITFDNKKSDND